MGERFREWSARLTLMLFVSMVCIMLVPFDSQAAKKSDISKYALVFDSQYYYDNNPDVAAVYGNDYNKLLTHYINNGVNEGRNASAVFNAKAYKENNPDLQSAYGNNWAGYHEHFAAFGKNENRIALPGRNANNNKNNSNNNANKAANVNPGNVIGIYATKYDAKIPRANNVAVAASRINGVVVKKGEDFSFNATILPRTTANGYVNAPIFINKKHGMGIGGGVCQVSSTLYAAMLSAGLPATERHPHSLKVPYIPEGMDATIAGNTLDLRFTNTFDYAIVIGAVADNGTLTVSISRY